jgi:hypothetical protein
MTGAEHYEHAEMLLDFAGGDDTGSAVERYHLRAAQVHATLALAAATALSTVSTVSNMPVRDADAWQDLAGTQPDQARGAQ